MIVVLFFFVFLCTLPKASLGHLFSDRADPKVGATVTEPPARVRIWFNGALESDFSTVVIQDASGKKVDNGDGRVNPSDATLLEVSLPLLPAGTYRVIWNAVARDGHRTKGNYTFVIK